MALVDIKGQVVGGWLVLERAKRPTGDGRWRGGEVYWLARCTGCRAERVLHGRALRVRARSGANGCITCFNRARAVPAAERRCAWCDASTVGQHLARECVACNQRARRNGRDESGRPRSATSTPEERRERQRRAARTRLERAAARRALAFERAEAARLARSGT